MRSTSEWEISVTEKGGIRHRKLEDSILELSSPLHSEGARRGGRERGRGAAKPLFLPGCLSVCGEGGRSQPATSNGGGAASSQVTSERAGAC